MSETYYINLRACPKCGHSTDSLKVGHSAAGWVFGLNVYPERGINNLVDWIKLFMAEDSWLHNGDGQRVGARDMLRIITERKMRGLEASGPGERYSSWAEFHDAHQSEFAPCGLLRSHLKGDARWRLVSQGEGTWDCIEELTES